MLPNTRLIPADLAARFAPTIARHLDGRVRLRRPDLVEHRDEVTGRTSFVPVPAYWEGPARVQSRGGGPPVGAESERFVASGGFLVAVPHTVTGVRPFDVVEVVAGGDDPALAGLLLVVDDVGAATVILQRNLSCTRHAGAAAGT